jgi:hypothetical protein
MVVTGLGFPVRGRRGRAPWPAGWPSSDAGSGGRAKSCSSSRGPILQGSSCSDGSSPAPAVSTLSSPQLFPRIRSCGLLPPSTLSRSVFDTIFNSELICADDAVSG